MIIKYGKSKRIMADRKSVSNEAHKWYNVSLTKDEYTKFRKFLNESGYEFEPSSEGSNVYVKVYLKKSDVPKVNEFLDSMDSINSACGKKSVKAGYQLQFPYMVEGEFADGYTYTAGGNSEAECVETLANMQDKHGKLVWYSGVTDEDYDAGRRIDSACGKKSIKSNKHRGIKASRSNAPRRRMRVMAGPGAGYTIEWELERIRRVNSFDVTDVSKPDKWGTVTVTADCDVDIDVTIKSAWSYMYGFNHPIEGVSAKIHRVVFDYNISDNYGDLLNFEDYEDLTDDAEYIDEVYNMVYQINEMDAVDILEDDAWEAIKGDEFSYGGGYTHSTWDGTLLEVDDYNFAFIQVTDPSVVEYIDKSVQGETNYSTYSVFVDDDATGYAFDTEEEAIADAKEYIESGNYEGDIANTYVVRDDWFEFYDGDTDLENSEIVWNAFDEYENY